jgi:hypothetical protein
LISVFRKSAGQAQHWQAAKTKIRKGLRAKNSGWPGSPCFQNSQAAGNEERPVPTLPIARCLDEGFLTRRFAPPK